MTIHENTLTEIEARAPEGDAGADIRVLAAEVRRLQAHVDASINLETHEEWAVREALLRTGGNVAKTCTLLGVGMGTVYRRAHGLGIAVGRQVVKP